MKTNYKGSFKPKLKYCPLCHHVWEFDAAQGKELKHSDFPAYGLQRVACSNCKKGSPI